MLKKETDPLRFFMPRTGLVLATRTISGFVMAVDVFYIYCLEPSRLASGLLISRTESGLPSAVRGV